MEQYTLANGVQIPVIGLGTWQTPDDETGYQAVLSALQSDMVISTRCRAIAMRTL